MVSCRWEPSITFRVRRLLAAGQLPAQAGRGRAGQQQYVPLDVRDDASTAAFVIQNSVTTWQAYNLWGGLQPLLRHDRRRAQRLRRPGAHRLVRPALPPDLGPGRAPTSSATSSRSSTSSRASDSTSPTGPTSTSTTGPQLLAKHQCLFSLGHDEYWSTPDAQRCRRRPHQGHQPGLPRGQRLLPPDPSRVLAGRAEPAGGLLQGRRRGPDGRRRSRPDHRQLERGPGQPAREHADRQHVPVGAAPTTTWSSPTPPTGCSTGAGSPTVSTCPRWSRASTTATCPACPGPTNVDVICPLPGRPPGKLVRHHLLHDTRAVVACWRRATASFVGKLSNTTAFPSNIVPAAIPGVTDILLRAMENVYGRFGNGPASAAQPSGGNWALDLPGVGRDGRLGAAHQRGVGRPTPSDQTGPSDQRQPMHQHTPARPDGPAVPAAGRGGWRGPRGGPDRDPGPRRLQLEPGGHEEAGADVDHDHHHGRADGLLPADRLAPCRAAPAFPSGRPSPSRWTTTRRPDPRAGLDKADIVFEEPVEGGITRYVAVFQCQQAALVGPVRSARNIDIGILGQLGSPLLAHVGGIDPVIANIDASPIINVDLGRLRLGQPAPARAVRPLRHLRLDPGDVGPQARRHHAAHAGLRLLRPSRRRGHPWARCHIPFSRSLAGGSGSTTPKPTPFCATTGSSPDMLANGVQNTGGQRGRAGRPRHLRSVAREQPRGASRCRPTCTTTPAARPRSSAAGWRWRAPGTVAPWARPPSSPRRPGRTIALQPGPTWVELVPSTVAVGVNPPSRRRGAEAPSASPNVTGMCDTPACLLVRTRRSGPARRKSSNRVRSSSSMIRISIRARFAPRQKWLRWPKARWGLGLRRTSKRNGSSKTVLVEVGRGPPQGDLVPASTSRPPLASPGWPMRRL